MAGGNLSDTLLPMTYENVVGRDTACLAFLIKDSNDLDILTGDIQKAYMNTLAKDKVFFYTVHE